MHSFRRVKTMAALAVALGSLLAWDHASATSAPIRADTFVSSVTKNQNYGSSPLLSVSPTSITFLLFDLTALPPGVSDLDIEKANVLIEIASVTAPGTLAVFPVLTNWSESGITFNNAPALGTAPIVTLPVTSPSTAQIVAVDVTAQVRNWLKNPGAMNNFGIALVAVGAPPTASLFFTSKEGINAPILDVTLMDQGPAGPAGWPTGSERRPGRGWRNRSARCTGAPRTAGRSGPDRAHWCSWSHWSSRSGGLCRPGRSAGAARHNGISRRPGPNGSARADRSGGGYRSVQRDAAVASILYAPFDERSTGVERRDRPGDGSRITDCCLGSAAHLQDTDRDVQQFEVRGDDAGGRGWRGS